MIQVKTYLSIIGLVILTTTSCAQKSKNSSNDFKTIIYDTYHMMGENLVPKEYWYSMDKYLKLNIDVDSVLFVRINGEIDDRKEIPKDEKAQRIRLEDLHKCSSLGFFEFKSISIGKNSQDLIDFKIFPELRYVHSDYLFNEKQFADLLSTAKKLKGLQIKINFPVPDCICELNDLRYLIITNQGGVSLPPCIKNMSNLKYLAFGGEGIGADGKLNKTIWNIPSLELLTIDGGSHVEIQPTVKNMNHLKQLNITSVDSISFSNEFTKLDSLELLVFSWIDKKIKFPNNFNHLQSLRGINLAQVRVNQLPITNNHSNIEFISYASVHELDSIKNLHFYNLEHLKHLWIQGAFSQVDSIPKGIESLPSLESLELHGFGFSYNNDLSKRINKYNHSSDFGGEFDKTFDYYKWLFIFGKPSKYIQKMY